jgi:hypothetical protein
MHQLPKTISSRVNRLSHRQALAHEQRIKSELMAQLLKARTDGASFEDLTAMIDKLEGAQPAG